MIYACVSANNLHINICIQIDFRKKVDEKEERLRREEVEGERDIQEESRKLQLLRYWCTACMTSVQHGYLVRWIFIKI